MTQKLVDSELLEDVESMVCAYVAIAREVGTPSPKAKAVWDALRAALSAPQQEVIGVVQETIIEDNSEWECIEWKSDRPPVGTLLYTHSAPQQEEVAWRRWEPEHGGMFVYYETAAYDDCEPLYTHPAPSVPEAMEQYPLRGDEPVGPQASRADYVRGWNACRDAMLAAAPKAPTTDDRKDAGITDVIAERRRQIEAEGWTAEHDDQHQRGDLAIAAACYAAFASAEDGRADASRLTSFAKSCWPWGREWWKPKIGNPRRDLVRAAALLIAEIDRLDRAAIDAAMAAQKGEKE